MSNNEVKEYQVGAPTIPLADTSKVNQGTVAIESSRAMVEAHGKLLLSKQTTHSLTPRRLKRVSGKDLLKVHSILIQEEKIL